MADVPVILIPAPLTAVRVCPPRPAGAAPGGPAQAQGDTAEQARSALERQLAELRQAQAALADGLRQLQELRGQLRKQAEQQAVELALQIARKVLAQELQAGRVEIDPIVQEVLRRAPAGGPIVVRMNPQDLQRCSLAQAQAADEAQQPVQFQADPAIRPAQVVVETAEGFIESDVSAHLQQVADALKAGGPHE